MAALVGWRCDTVTQLVASLRNALPSQVKLNVIATCQRPHATALLEGMDLQGLAQVADTIELPLYQPSADRVEADAYDALRRMAGGRARPRALLRPGPPDMSSSAQLADTVSRLASQGINDFSFYNYGMLRQRDLHSIGAIAANHQ